MRNDLRCGVEAAQYRGSACPNHAWPPTSLGEVGTSVQAISWVIQYSRHKGNSFVVLLMIANHARSDGSGAWPSIPTLAKESRVSERTVQRTINRLRRTTNKIPPELVVEDGKGPHGCNLYSIPGVKLSSPWVSVSRDGGVKKDWLVSDNVTPPVSPLSPEPSFNRPIKPSDKEEEEDIPF